MGRYTVNLERVIDAGEEFAFVVLTSGSGASSGAPHVYRWGYVGRITDGLIVYLQAYLNADEALEAVG
jgi:ketosteroid isomerase-like protein